MLTFCATVRSADVKQLDDFTCKQPVVRECALAITVGVGLSTGMGVTVTRTKHGYVHPTHHFEDGNMADLVNRTLYS